MRLDDTPAARVLATGAPDLGRLVELRWPDGRWSILQTDSVPLVVSGEDAGMVLTTFADVTQRVVAQRELETERRVLDATLATVRAGVVGIDAHGRVTMTNRAFDELVGFRSRPGVPFAAIGGRIGLRPADADAGARFAPTRALAGDAVHDEAAHVVACDGTTKDVLLSATPLRLGDSIGGAVVTLHDVTALRRAAVRSEPKNGP